MDTSKDAKYYQELTYDALGKILEEEARKGNSKWYCSRYNIGNSMVKFLQDKGFSINYLGDTYQNISW